MKGLAEHVAQMRKQEMYTEFWCGNLLENSHLEVQAEDERLILN
jgi:hypothetical protein